MGGLCGGASCVCFASRGDACKQCNNPLEEQLHQVGTQVHPCRMPYLDGRKPHVRAHPLSSITASRAGQDG